MSRRCPNCGQIMSCKSYGGDDEDNPFDTLRSVCTCKQCKIVINLDQMGYIDRVKIPKSIKYTVTPAQEKYLKYLYGSMPDVISKAFASVLIQEEIVKRLKQRRNAEIHEEFCRVLKSSDVDPYYIYNGQYLFKQGCFEVGFYADENTYEVNTKDITVRIRDTDNFNSKDLDDIIYKLNLLAAQLKTSAEKLQLTRE